MDSDENYSSTPGVPESQQAKVLVIEKRYCKIYEKGYEYKDEQTGSQYVLCGILGVLNVLGYNFLVGITEKQYIAKIEGANIFLIKRIELIPFFDEAINQMQINAQLRDYVDGVKKLLNNGYFYFSYNTDLTSNK